MKKNSSEKVFCCRLLHVNDYVKDSSTRSTTLFAIHIVNGLPYNTADDILSQLVAEELIKSGQSF